MKRQDLDLVCPTCQRAFPPKLVVSGAIRQRIVNIIAHCPDGIIMRGLVDLVYANDPNGGPNSAEVCIRTHIWKANQQLIPKGYKIRVSWPGPGARYVLEKLEEPVYSFASMKEAVRSARADAKRQPSGNIDARAVEGA